MKVLSDNQRKAINKLNKFKVGALFMDTGEGKTRTIVELVNSVSNIDFILYIAPYSSINTPFGIKSVINEVDKWEGFNAPVEYAGIESIGMSDRIYLNIMSKLSSCHNPFIIVDESIKMKNFDAIRTKRVIELSKYAEYKLIANATPITRNILDIWCQMYFLSPKILNMSLSEFENTFCEKTKITKIIGKNINEKTFVSGFANIDYLYSIIGHYVYECDSDNKNEIINNDISFSIDNKSEYYTLKEKYLDNEMLLWKNNNIFMEMTQKMQHSYCLSEEKTEKVRTIIKDLDKKRTIIYCKYIDSQNHCKKLFPESLVLSYQKNALSLNLQYDYDNTIFWDKIWDYYLVKQAKGRTNRIGRDKPVRYIGTTGNVGLESLIDKNIDTKTSMADYVRKVSYSQLNQDL